MLMAILNVEQARSSNVKRDQPNPKFSNWHFTATFYWFFLSNFLFLVNRGGHVWWKFESLIIILKEDHNCIISLKFGNNWHFTGFKKKKCKCSIFNNSGDHVWWWLKLSTIILKGNHKCIIFLKSENNWPFSEFFYWNFCQIFFFLITVVAMFDGSSGHQL
jgi:hypothetical protein